MGPEVSTFLAYIKPKISVQLLRL